MESSTKLSKSSGDLKEKTKKVFKINKETLPLKIVLFLYCGGKI